MNSNIILLTDGYKPSHFCLYPPNTTEVYSYFEPRIGAKFKKTFFFGLQYFLKRYLVGQVVTKDKIDYAEDFFKLYFGRNVFNVNNWRYILEKHDGKLPVEIKSLPEGTCVNESNVLMTVKNTDPNCYWLTNQLETILSEIWYPSTVLSKNFEMKTNILRYLYETGNPSLIEFAICDFGFRGCSCPEQAALGGAAHLVNFKGTDTLPAVLMLRDFYNEQMAGFSIPATEHSTITSWGRENELEACRNVLERYPTGIVACVSDSYDIFKCCNEIWGDSLKGQVLSRDGILVVRPDSGDPLDVLPKVLAILADKLGCSVNAKGYKVLCSKIRVIQGDGIDIKSIDEILSCLMQKGWSADNLTFGSGGGLLVKDITRDTQKFAFKCSSITVNGEEKDVWKDPITDKGKKSKKGKIKLVYDNNKEFITVPLVDSREDQLRTVFRNGSLLIDYSLEEIRNRTNSYL